ncbi:MAG: acetolactate synthase small subunit [Fimbriimonadaceae bacterium]
MTATAQQHTIVVLVQNETGTINRLVSMFRRRGFSLACFSAGDCEIPGFSRLTLVVNGDDEALRQCLRQLDKLIDVVEVQDLKPDQSVARELALIRVEPSAADREAVYALVSEFMARTPKSTATALIIEVAAELETIERFIAALKPYNITEIVRTGTIATKVGD